jgi:hypothetical protein
MRRSPMDHPVLAGALIAVLTCAVAPTVGAVQGEKKPKLEESQRKDAQALIALVDEFATGKAPATSLQTKWEQHHYIKALAEKTYVPFTLTIEPAASAAPNVGVYLRVVARGTAAVAPPPPEKDKDKKKGTDQPSQYAFEDLYFTDLPAAAAGRPQLLRRAFAVAPGDYDVYVAVKERAAGGAAGSGSGTAEAAPRLGVLKQEISVPNFAGPDLTTSSVIVAESVDVMQTPLAADNQAEHAYTFGQMKVVPALESKFSKKGQLTVILWIYGAKLDETTKKPDVNMEFKFYQKAADKETYFNKTEPQVLNAQTLPPQFDLAAGHQLLGTLELPLASFPEGDYRLEIDVQDKVSSQKLTKDVTFTVTGA